MWVSGRSCPARSQPLNRLSYREPIAGLPSLLLFSQTPPLKIVMEKLIPGSTAILYEFRSLNPDRTSGWLVHSCRAGLNVGGMQPEPRRSRYAKQQTDGRV